MATSEAVSTSSASSSQQSQASSTVWDDCMQTTSFPHPELSFVATDHHLETVDLDEVAAMSFSPTEFISFSDGFWNFVDNIWETMPVSDIV
ncbi:hypothetical protein GUJ93_ZPchr0001g32877 [Zizania palustris]|uniref:Uncharacterized protein n=1 Tax=Zizania palustris TaxID=103762 RepID=A0A8J5VUB4_ZIZPA|nr:hypothetical protein GUJ93_ZPchr0001g32877 [Zizania palustris]